MSIKGIPERIGYLSLLFLHKELSPLERKELDKWILEDDLHEALFEEIVSPGEESAPKTKIQLQETIKQAY
jgi:hypothetical protein